MEKRTQWVDILKFICIMFVILSHLDLGTEFLRKFYEPFCLNGFFFASGYVYKNRGDFADFFKKKARTILLPWFVFSVGSIILSQILTFGVHETFFEELKWNFLQIRGKGDGLWFLAALFVAFIPFYFAVKWYENSCKTSKERVILLCAVMILAFASSAYSRLMPHEMFIWESNALPWHIEYIFPALLWMVIGYLFRNRYEELYYDKMTLFTKLSCCVAYVVLLWASYKVKAVENTVLLWLFHTYLIKFFGLFSVVWVCKLIRNPGKYVLYIGQNTLLCFALHGKICAVFEQIVILIIRKLTGNSMLYYSIYYNPLWATCLTVIVVLAISVLMIPSIYFINRWLPFLIGKGRQCQKN